MEIQGLGICLCSTGAVQTILKPPTACSWNRDYLPKAWRLKKLEDCFIISLLGLPGLVGLRSKLILDFFRYKALHVCKGGLWMRLIQPRRLQRSTSVQYNAHTKLCCNIHRYWYWEIPDCTFQVIWSSFFHHVTGRMANYLDQQNPTSPVGSRLSSPVPLRKFSRGALSASPLWE